MQRQTGQLLPQLAASAPPKQPVCSHRVITSINCRLATSAGVCSFSALPSVSADLVPACRFLCFRPRICLICSIRRLRYDEWQRATPYRKADAEERARARGAEGRRERMRLAPLYQRQAAVRPVQAEGAGANRNLRAKGWGGESGAHKRWKSEATVVIFLDCRSGRSADRTSPVRHNEANAAAEHAVSSHLAGRTSPYLFLCPSVAASVLPRTSPLASPVATRVTSSRCRVISLLLLRQMTHLHLQPLLMRPLHPVWTRRAYRRCPSRLTRSRHESMRQRAMSPTIQLQRHRAW